MDYYILEGTKHRKAKSIPEYLEWAKEANRRIDYTELHDGSIYVSTVFLGLDHSFDGGRPVLYETMIFGGEHDEYQERYYTYQEAKEGHQRAVALVFE